ncbi:MAG: hypothetical protein WCV85_04205 [Patescibacteria group bacterium]|jgi:hypothetical protein
MLKFFSNFVMYLFAGILVVGCLPATLPGAVLAPLFHACRVSK